MSKKYLVLLRGINVGGKNGIRMSDLKTCLTELGFSDVTTYIASGNVVLKSGKTPVQIQALIENALAKDFKLNSQIRVLVLTHQQLQAVIDQKPKGFGDQPTEYHSDAIFLLGVSVEKALAAFSPREGVDTVWPGPGVIYSQRLSARRTQSRMNVIVTSPLYKSMTIRNWRTTTKLLTLLDELAD